MGELTSDPRDPRLTRGADDANSGWHEQAPVYLVLSEEDLAKGFVRPVRTRYIHDVCETVTVMGQQIAETYARNPNFYGATYCAKCGQHRPVGKDGEFYWDDGEGSKVGT